MPSDPVPYSPDWVCGNYQELRHAGQWRSDCCATCGKHKNKHAVAPSDPVPLEKLWFVSMTGEEVQGYLASDVDALLEDAPCPACENREAALAAKDETIAALREKSVVKEGLLQLALQAVQEHEAELSAVRQQLADAQQTIKELKG